MMRRLSLVALVLACNTHSPQAPIMKATHDNGLSFEYDERVREIVPLPDGYTLQLGSANTRAVNEITIRVHDAPVAGIDTWQEKKVGPRTYRFTEEQLDGGSGGDEYKLAIVAPWNSRRSRCCVSAAWLAGARASTRRLTRA